MFRVLPFATITKGGSGDDPVGTREVIRDLSSLVQHVESGWTVVMLTNPPDMRSTSYFQIGGGKVGCLVSVQKFVVLEFVFIFIMRPSLAYLSEMRC